MHYVEGHQVIRAEKMGLLVGSMRGIIGVLLQDIEPKNSLSYIQHIQHVSKIDEIIYKLFYKEQEESNNE